MAGIAKFRPKMIMTILDLSDLYILQYDKKKNSWVANEKQTRHMWNRFEGIG